MGRTTAEIGERYAAAKPLAKRVASDRKLRRHAHEALGSAQRLHQLLREDDRRAWPARLATDEDAQRELGTMISELRAAGQRIKRQRQRRVWLRILAAAGLAVLAYRLSRRTGAQSEEAGSTLDGAGGTGLAERA